MPIGIDYDGFQISLCFFPSAGGNLFPLPPTGALRALFATSEYSCLVLAWETLVEGQLFVVWSVGSVGRRTAPFKRLRSTLEGVGETVGRWGVSKMV